MEDEPFDETCISNSVVRVNHAWNLMKLEEDDLGLTIAAERPYEPRNGY
jgi:hypothetical protein